MSDKRQVTVSFQADLAYLRVVRMTATAMGADAGLTVHDLDDLALAVDELTAALVALGEGEITLELSADDRGVVVRGSSTADGPAELDPIATSIVQQASDKFDLDEETAAFTIVKLAQALA